MIGSIGPGGVVNEGLVEQREKEIKLWLSEI